MVYVFLSNSNEVGNGTKNEPFQHHCPGANSGILIVSLVASMERAVLDSVVRRGVPASVWSVIMLTVTRLTRQGLVAQAYNLDQKDC